jgi:hypothetical protein
MERLFRYVAGFLLIAGIAIAGNVGPMMIQKYGADIDNPSAFWANIGGGAVGKLNLGAGCANDGSGNLTCAGAVASVQGHTGAVTLGQSDINGALGYTPLNKGGDTATGLIGFTQTNGATAAGTTQGTATAITAQVTVFTTVPAGSGTVLNTTAGVRQVIYNRGASTLAVYPFSGAQIEAYGANTAVGIAVGGSAVFECVSSTQCYVGI